MTKIYHNTACGIWTYYCRKSLGRAL